MNATWMNEAAASAAEASPQVVAPVAVVPGRVLHIDGDLLAYWASGNEDTDAGVARRVAADKVAAMAYHAGAEAVVLHLTSASSSKGDRFIISTVRPYQGNRKGASRPKNWAYLRSWMESYVGPLMRVKLWFTREADDGMAYAACWSPEHSVIATKDKDMRMLPGWHMNWDTMALHYVPKGTFDLVHDGKQYGHKWFWLQMLHGDAADNIPGLPRLGNKRCGPATAAALLEGSTDNDHAFDIVSDAYASCYAEDWQDAMLEQALLLWLRTDRDATFGDVYDMLPPSHFDIAMQRIKLRVKEKYAEAHRRTGGWAPRADVG